MRNPKWERDEIILALDLYFDLKPSEINSGNPKVLELSKLLNRLPIHQEKLINSQFRNPNGVGLKLANFIAISSNGLRGMKSYSKLDKAIFLEFQNDKDSLKIIANRIRKVIQDDDLIKELDRLPNESEEGIEYFKEGRVLYKLHRYRERNSKIVNQKKESILKRTGKLQCEACKFDFKDFYGDIGVGFAECHHIVPLNMYTAKMKTKLSDLIILCANCHRMIHRKENLTLDKLIEIIKNNKNA